jgi:hypothetical protein
MFSVGLFYSSLGVLLALFGFRYLENVELGTGRRYFHSLRSWIDTAATTAKQFSDRNLSLASLAKMLGTAMRTVQHYSARALAALGHMLEHRARRVVHRTAKRARTDHYLSSDVSTEKAEDMQVEK